MGIIEATALTRRFADRVVVDALDLEVRAGSITGFLGPNGAGKTTTLRMLLGLIAPTSGTARVCGVPVGRDGKSRRAVGALVETPAFYGGMSARSNLEVFARTSGVRVGRPELERVLARVGLSGRGDDPVQTYSLGMKQRLGVAAALLPDPRVLFLDEPTNGLDPQGQLEMRGLLQALAAEGKTLFVSSHLLRDVEQMCTDLVVLARGKKVAEGSMAALVGSKASVRVRAGPGAQEVLQRERPRLEAVVTGGWLEVRVPDGAPDALAAELVRVLTHAGVSVYELTTRAGLEQTFFELTGAAS